VVERRDEPTNIEEVEQNRARTPEERIAPLRRDDRPMSSAPFFDPLLAPTRSRPGRCPTTLFEEETDSRRE